MVVKTFLSLTPKYQNYTIIKIETKKVRKLKAKVNVMQILLPFKHFSQFLALRSVRQCHQVPHIINCKKMLFDCFITVIVIVYIFCDLNYFIRTFFTVWCGRIYRTKHSLNEVTTIYGLCTFQDCNIWFRSIRLARIVRELDFARYHFYDRTGIYHRSRLHNIKSLQGSTLIVTLRSVPLFKFYKIRTKLVYWDERSFFFEHEVVTLHDDRVRCLLVSRQYALGTDKEPTVALLKGLPGSSSKLSCPEYIQLWLDSMKLSSEQLRIQRK